SPRGLRSLKWTSRPHPLLWISLFLSLLALILEVPKGSLPTLTGRHKALRAQEKLAADRLALLSQLSTFLPPPLSALLSLDPTKPNALAPYHPIMLNPASQLELLRSGLGLRFWNTAAGGDGIGRWWSVEELGEGASVVRSRGEGGDREVWVLRMGEGTAETAPLVTSLTHSLLLRDRLQSEVATLKATPCPPCKSLVVHEHQHLIEDEEEEWDRFQDAKRREREREREVQEREKEVGRREKWVVEEMRKLSDKVHHEATELTLEDRITERLKAYQRQLMKLGRGGGGHDELERESTRSVVASTSFEISNSIAPKTPRPQLPRTTLVDSSNDERAPGGNRTSRRDPVSVKLLLSAPAEQVNIRHELDALDADVTIVQERLCPQPSPTHGKGNAVPSPPKSRFSRLASHWRFSRPKTPSPPKDIEEQSLIHRRRSSTVSCDTLVEYQDPATFLLALLAPVVSALQKLSPKSRLHPATPELRDRFKDLCDRVIYIIEGLENEQPSFAGEDVHETEMRQRMLSALKRKVVDEQLSLQPALETMFPLAPQPTRNPFVLHSATIHLHPAIRTTHPPTAAKSIPPVPKVVRFDCHTPGSSYRSFVGSSQLTSWSSNIVRLGSFQASALFTPSPIAVKRVVRSGVTA
ncbi:hypothetical protein P7C73_g5639, partial [Tremellales sp. Uapishka_1]